MFGEKGERKEKFVSGAHETSVVVATPRAWMLRQSDDASFEDMTVDSKAALSGQVKEWRSLFRTGLKSHDRRGS